MTPDETKQARALVDRLKEKALFGCRNPCCASEVSYDADNLAVAPDGEPTCHYCWDEDRTDDDPEWCDLPAFLPFDFITASLVENERLREALKEISCPHVTDKPLWWQAAARAALAGETDQ